MCGIWQTFLRSIAISTLLIGGIANALVQDFSQEDQWPGRNGPLKAGFRFDPADYPTLQGYQISSDRFELTSWEGITGDHGRRTITFGKKPKVRALLVDIEVIPTTCKEAQAVLARTNGTSLGNPEGPSEVVGQSRGLQIGDVCLITTALQEMFEKLGEIRFVRNNIVVRMTALPNHHFPVVPLAREIDAKIVAQQDHTPVQFAAKLPVISSWTPAKPRLHVFKAMTMTLAATDPMGLALDFQFQNTHGVTKHRDQEDPAVTTFFAGDMAGEATLTAWCFNEALLVSKAQTTVTIVN